MSGALVLDLVLNGKSERAASLCRQRSRLTASKSEQCSLHDAVRSK